METQKQYELPPCSITYPQSRAPPERVILLPVCCAPDAGSFAEVPDEVKVYICILSYESEVKVIVRLSIGDTTYTPIFKPVESSLGEYLYDLPPFISSDAAVTGKYNTDSMADMIICFFMFREYDMPPCQSAC